MSEAGGRAGYAAGALVDVSIPTLGESPFLSDAIESVQRQTLKAWKLIISENDLGNPAVAQIIAIHMQDPRVTHRVTGARLSAARHFTSLIRLGSAPYVALLHDDDTWDEAFLERRVTFLEENPGCGFVFGGHMMIDENSVVNGQLTLKLEEGVHRSETILPKLFQYNLVGPPTVVVRRSAYEAVGSKYRDVMLTDHDMWVRLAARFDVGFLRVWDSELRVHDAQVSASRRLDLGRGHLEVLDSVKDIAIPVDLRRRERAKAHLCSSLDAVELGERRDALAQIRCGLRADPSYFLRPSIAVRLLFAGLALVLGGIGREALSRLRYRRFLGRSTGMSRAQRDF